MQNIPKPELLNPNRIDRDEREDFTVDDHRSRAELFAKALDESCAYAEQLWEQNNALRAYLLDSLPPDPRAPGVHTTTAASPTGPDDEQGWLDWINAFATTTSVLCGPHGDSGFGLSRARREAQLRRTAPELTLHVNHPDLGKSEKGAPPVAAAPVVADAGGSPLRPTSTSVTRAAISAVVAVLAVRGLRTLPGTRRHSTDL